MVASGAHRATGAALYFGTALVVFWLIAAASGPGAFAWASWAFGSILGRLVLFAYSWTLIQHMLGGVRHLVWDTGHGLQKATSTKIALATFAGSFALTALLWLVVIAI